MAISKVATYAPSLVRVQLFGIPIEGFAPDAVVSIERDEPVSTTRKAIDGSRTVFVDNNGTYRVTISLLQTSPSNTWLHQLFKVYSKIGVELIMPITIDDKSNATGSSVFFCTDTFFESEPSTKYSNQAEVTEWVFLCHNAQYDRVGSIQTYDLAEQLRSLFAALQFANAFNVNLGELMDVTEIMLENVNLQEIGEWF